MNHMFSHQAEIHQQCTLINPSLAHHPSLHQVPSQEDLRKWPAAGIDVKGRRRFSPAPLPSRGKDDIGVWQVHGGEWSLGNRFVMVNITYLILI